jgi:hypothetical protein
MLDLGINSGAAKVAELVAELFGRRLWVEIMGNN